MPQTAQTLSGPQRLRALEHANAVRLARAELKRRIAMGDVSAAEVILACPESVQRWTVGELLTSQRRWGSKRCRKFLERNAISEIKLLGSLTERQRRLLAAQLRDSRDSRDSRGPLSERIGQRPELATNDRQRELVSA